VRFATISIRTRPSCAASTDARCRSRTATRSSCSRSYARSKHASRRSRPTRARSASRSIPTPRRSIRCTRWSRRPRTRALADGMRAGTFAYGEAKRRLAAAIAARYADARARRRDLTAGGCRSRARHRRDPRPRARAADDDPRARRGRVGPVGGRWAVAIHRMDGHARPSSRARSSRARTRRRRASRPRPRSLP
jgi:hypothetical protein